MRAELVARLRARSAEIEEALILRVRALSDPTEEDDPEYRSGLRATITEVFEYALMSIEHGPEWSGPIPPAVAAQARRATRHGIRLDTVLRRYAAGDRLLSEFIMEEADRLSSQGLRQVLRTQGYQVDRLMAAVAAEYMDEREQMRRSPTQRLAERVQRLLVGDGPIDLDDLDYEFNGWHLGVVVMGATATEVLRAVDRPMLVVPSGNEVVWAWLGTRRRLASSEIDALAATAFPKDASLAIGEPRRGIDGWRLTHQEARAAYEVMLRRPQPVTKSSEVVLLAAVLRDEALSKSLLTTYLEPLGGDSGAVLRETLRAYFSAGSNAATAAAALGVDRHTVQRRLRKVEETLGRLLPCCHAELEVALSLEELDDVVWPAPATASG
jgi:PucR C-terminal helix-turn-helix domain/GGDEF-like domain